MFSIDSPPPDYRPPRDPGIFPGSHYTLPARITRSSLRWDCPYCGKTHRASGLAFLNAHVGDVIETRQRCPLWLESYGGPRSAHSRNELAYRWGGRADFDERLFLRIAA
jgi:hypothetical protein